MCFELIDLNKAFVANLTNIWFFTCVCAAVLQEGITSRKALVANLARMGLFACVNELVLSKIGLMSEWFVTNFANIWFFTCVSEVVLHERIISSKTLVANFTNIWCFFYLNMAGHLEIAVIRKKKKSCKLHTHMQLFIRMNKSVFFFRIYL